MDSLKQKVINSLKWKKNTTISAQRCDMNEDDYIRIKKEVLQERRRKEKEVNFLVRLQIILSL